MASIVSQSPAFFKALVIVSMALLLRSKGATAQCSPFLHEAYDRFSKKNEYAVAPLILKSRDYELHITIHTQLRRIEMTWLSAHGKNNQITDPNFPKKPNQVELLFDDDKPAEYVWSEGLSSGDFWIRKESSQITAEGVKTTRDDRLDKVWEKLRSLNVVALKIWGLDKQTNYPLIFDLSPENQIYFKSIIACIEK